MKLLRIAIIFILSPLMLTACEGLREIGVNIDSPFKWDTDAERHRNGPPPYAPAHGYRHKNPDGVELRFNSDLGVYIVVDMPNVYYYNGLYLRLSGDRWQATSDLKHSWHDEQESRVPYQLKEKKGRGHDKKSKKQGHGKKDH